MSKKPKQFGERQGKRINLSEERECRYWSERFGIRAEELRALVREVGPMVSDVERLLRRRRDKSTPSEPRKA